MTTPPPCPLVVEISPPPDPEDLFQRLAGLPHALFLDSALRDPALGRYSFLAADPWDYFETSPDDADSLGGLARRMAPFQASSLPGLPPFQGGAAGLLAYDLGRQLEKLPAPALDEFRLPAMAIGLYDVVAAFDHVERRFWIVSQGFPEREPEARMLRARRRLEQFQDWLTAPAACDFRQPKHGEPAWPPGLTELHPLAPAATPADFADLRPEELAPCHQVPGREGLWSNFSESSYLEAVRRAIDYIYAGDVFQVNLAQRLLARAADDSAALYLRLRKRNPAPFAGYFDLGRFQIASASPERFLRVADGQVETRPIKGTRPCTSRPEADLLAGNELLADEKERAENVMIVDLLRNDLSRVCRPESVYVSQLCRLESYPFVQHLVSAVRGTLRQGCGPIELVRASFPGGSVTGAPKVRAMEIIAQLEPTARGPYCGSLGYLGFDGSLDLNILIRTITAGRGWWQAPVGGAVVAQSQPWREYEETWHKAEGLLKAMW